MAVIDVSELKDGYELAVIGTGFGSLFFVHQYIKQNPEHRVLLLEQGEVHSRHWQISEQKNSSYGTGEDTYNNLTPEKPWAMNIGFGGGTNCWWAMTPRMTPGSFKMASDFGIGQDWPVSYEDLAPYYAQVETIMNLAGPDDLSQIFPGQKGYVQPPHRFSTVDEIMKAAQPEMHFAAPQARATRPVNGRAPCCATNNCHLCPINSRFSWYNGFVELLENDNIDVLPQSEVREISVEAGVVKDVYFIHQSEVRQAKADLFVLGANAIHSPAILMRSGFKHKALGAYLHEKLPVVFEVKLDGLDHFDGGSVTTGLNFSLSEGDFQSKNAASLLYFHNHWAYQGMRPEFGRWRQTLAIEAYIETEPLAENKVTVDSNGDVMVSHALQSSYAEHGLEYLESNLPKVLSPLPVEDIELHHRVGTIGHIQGTLRMGDDPSESIVDADNLHHQARNLVVVGTATWPSCTTVNPSLTIAALSIRAAEKLS